jgi:outer membrane protein OmpA-like peptidoglycan-associated protein
MPIKSWSIATLVLLVPLASHATDIRQRSYSHSFDSAVAKEDDQFVVCSACPDNQLSKMPMIPKLALRMSTHLKPEVSVTREERLELKSDGISANKPVHHAPILFGFDSAQLSFSERDKLNTLLANLPRSGTYDLTGFTCSIGRGDYNEKLSIRRANLVADIFKANGLNVGKVEGRGKCCPVSEEMQLNRRVEILEHRKEEK